MMMTRALNRTLAVAVPVALSWGCRDEQLLLAPTTQPAALQAGQDDPVGFIEYPRIGDYNFKGPDPTNRNTATLANLNRQFTIRGWVNFPPDEGELQVYVDDFGDDEGVSQDSTLVSTAQPSSTTRTVNGRTVWAFSIGPIAPFLEAEKEAQKQNKKARPWPDGGTAKIRVHAFSHSSGISTLLRGRDRDGIEGNESGPSLAFADKDATPVSQRFYSEPSGGLYAIPKYLGRKMADPPGPDETFQYYASVFLAKDGIPVAHQPTIWTHLHYLRDFKKRYFESLKTCSRPGSLAVDDSPAIYFNKGDLGIGREMRCSYNPCSEETACYVKNYGDRNGKGLFTGDMGPSLQAIEGNKPFATVAMVSRGLARSSRARDKVFFAVYSGDETSPGRSDSLLMVAPLDNRKFNRFIPGNCLGCHGAAAQYDRNVPTGKASGAQFLPFDLQHGLAFYSTTGPLSRADQEEKFRTLNQIIATTDLYTLPDARALLNGFYGVGPDATRGEWGSTFQSDWVPLDWNTSGNTRQLYKKIIAPYCRTCHISYDEKVKARLAFGSFSDFTDPLTLALIRASVCIARDQNIMPNAEVTSKAFWRSDARAQLVQRAGFPGCGLREPEPTMTAQLDVGHLPR